MLAHCILYAYICSYILSLLVQENSKQPFLAPPFQLDSTGIKHISRFWAGLHDNVPDRPSAKVAATGCQLATIALNIETVTTPKGGLHGRRCDSFLDVSPSGLSNTKLADLIPPWQSIRWDVVVQPGPAYLLGRPERRAVSTKTRTRLSYGPGPVSGNQSQDVIIFQLPSMCLDLRALTH